MSHAAAECAGSSREPVTRYDYTPPRTRAAGDDEYRSRGARSSAGALHISLHMRVAHDCVPSTRCYLKECTPWAQECVLWAHIRPAAVNDA